MIVGIQKNRAIMVGLVLLTVFFGIKWQQNIGKYFQVDFAAYWSAGRALNEGVYRYSYKAIDSDNNIFHHSMFLNPPIVAHPFRLIALLPYHKAKTTWFYTQIILFVGTVILLSKNKGERITILAIAIIGMPFIYLPLFAELERGETNMILLLLLALAYYLWRKKKIKLAGFVLGLGSAFKFPLLLLFAIPFVYKQWKFIVIGASTFISVFIVSLLVDGSSINRTYFIEYLPDIALEDRLPDNVFSVSDTVLQSTTKWEGRTYTSRYKFGASSGSATRFLRSLSNNRFDRSLIVGGAAITALVILLGYYRMKALNLSKRQEHQWEDIAWSAAVMATLILHTLSWITNYVMFTFVLILLWRFVLSTSSNRYLKLLKFGLLVGTAMILIGDPIITLIPSLSEGVDIIIRNRLWLGGTLIWGILLVLLLWPGQLSPSKQ